MCGFAGFIRFGDFRTEDRRFLEACNRLLAHRGPDGAGIWHEQKIGLAHRRLAVIDLTPAAAQPMSSDDGQYVIAYNGEVYNFKSLRSDLEAQGERFVSNSDTEVILLGWRRWGPSILDKLDGMYAFAIADRELQTVTLVRDRFGEKPLYWARTPDGWVFGSEIKALLAWDGFNPGPDSESILRYLSFQYCSGPETAFAGINRLPAAHWVTVKCDPLDNPQPQTYWTAPNPDARWGQKSDGERKEALLAELKLAVSTRMVSDVPVGAFLSGGVDSSAVVSEMCGLAPSRVETFSIGFAEADYDERKWANQVADQFGTKHRNEILTDSIGSLVDKIVWHYGEPFADPSAIPMFALSALARQSVTVALSGDGGDELLIGYGRYKDCYDLDQAGWPDPSKQAVARFLRKLIPGSLANVRPFGGLDRRLRLAGEAPAARYGSSLFAFEDQDLRSGAGEALTPLLDQSSTAILAPFLKAKTTFVSGASWADLHTYLPDDILTKVDIAAMSASLETRAPLLARGFAELALSIPSEHRMPCGILKGLFKSALEDRLSMDVLYRPKMGFGVPLEYWLRGPLWDYANDILLDGRWVSRGFFTKSYVEQLLREHKSGRHHHTRIWTMMMLELWYRVWVDERAKALAGANNTS